MWDIVLGMITFLLWVAGLVVTVYVVISIIDRLSESTAYLKNISDSLDYFIEVMEEEVEEERKSGRIEDVK